MTTFNQITLDDPDMKLGKHRKVITLPSFMGTIIQYSRPLDIQRDLDIDFREMYPMIDQTLKLLMVRNMKNSIYEIGIVCECESSTIAMSFVHFEKLILKGHIHSILVTLRLS